MPETVCDFCGKTFECQAFRIRMKQNGERKHLFCGRKCESEFRKAKPNCECLVCGKPIHRKKTQIDKNKNTFCSCECLNKWKETAYKGEGNHQYGLKGSLNSSWKSDEKISSYGYRLIRVLDHPFRNCDDMVFEHRLIAEKYLLNDDNSVEINGKRYLSPEYDVHHKDFDRQNNALSNLKVMTRPDLAHGRHRC